MLRCTRVIHNYEYPPYRGEEKKKKGGGVSLANNVHFLGLWVIHSWNQPRQKQSRLKMLLFLILILAFDCERERPPPPPILLDTENK